MLLGLIRPKKIVLFPFHPYFERESEIYFLPLLFSLEF